MTSLQKINNNDKDLHMIIDTHVHTFPDNIAPKAIGKLEKISGITPSTDGTVANTLSFMKKTGIDMFINLNIATGPNQQTTINNVAAQLNEQYGNDSMISIGSVHYMNPDSVNELHRIKELDIKGIKLHPDYQDFFISDKELYPIYDACSQLDIPIIFHSGWDCYSPDVIHAPPVQSAVVAKAFPKLKIVLAHFGGLLMWEDVLEHLAGLENVYLDTAMLATHCKNIDTIHKILNRHPLDNVMLGSDCPWENPANSVDFIYKLHISDSNKDKILYKNAMKFYKIHK